MPQWRRGILCDRPRVANTPLEGDPRLYGHDTQYREDNGSGQQRGRFGVAELDIFHTDVTFYRCELIPTFRIFMMAGGPLVMPPVCVF